ncbi:VQ motif-containing protein [Euphorbia peplus]|nr:VQ motif-containing protein [Euphorbia peplus]
MESNISGGPSSPLSSTTFVQADKNTFRDLVQKLTGLASPYSPKSPPAKPFSLAPRGPSFKLQERRKTIKKLEIQLGKITSNSQHSKVLSKPYRPEFSFPSPVTPLLWDSLFLRSPGTESPTSPTVLEEEKEIAEEEFSFHPLPLTLFPLTSPRGSDGPELLTLFPLTSPRQADQN